MPLVGGPKFAHMLFPPLEFLCAVDETVVRDKAVEAIKNIAKEIPDASTLESQLVPVIKRLAAGIAVGRLARCFVALMVVLLVCLRQDSIPCFDRSDSQATIGEAFAARSSACGIFPSAYGKSSKAAQADLRTYAVDLYLLFNY